MLLSLSFLKKLQSPVPPPAKPTNFPDFCSQLDKWEKELLQGCGILIPEPELADLIQSCAFVVGSDGSAPKRASWAWLLASKDGTYAVQATGIVKCHKPNSFRAESYAMLSALRFLIRFKEYMQITMDTPYTHFTDAQSVLDRLQPVELYQDYFANSTLEPEWDVINEIQHSLASLTKPPTFQYVKAHQDDKVALKDLPLSAQLNVRADGLATDILLGTASFPEDESTTTLLPHAGAQLHLSTGTVTGNLKRPLTNASRGPHLLDYIIAKNKWDPTTVDLVDWESHGIAVRNAPHPVTLVKFLHGLLPVGDRVHKYHPKYHLLCPSCLEARETIDHLYQCNCPSRKPWRSGFLKMLLDTADKLDIRPSLLAVMYDGCLAYLRGQDHIQPNRYDNDLRELVRQQNRIGWLNFLRGRWSKEWKRLQTIYVLQKVKNKQKPRRRSDQSFQLNSKPAKSQKTSKKKYHKKKAGNNNWSVTVIREMWKSLYALWELRNKDLHGHDSQSQSEAKHKLYLREIQLYYDRKHTYSQSLQSAFEQPFESFTDKSNYRLYSWLELWRPVLDTYDSEDEMD